MKGVSDGPYLTQRSLVRIILKQLVVAFALMQIYQTVFSEFELTAKFRSALVCIVYHTPSFWRYGLALRGFVNKNSCT